MEKTEIIVNDGNSYYYTTALFNAENPLGIVKATLKEYSIFKVTDSESLIGKLYRTKDGTWYDLPNVVAVNPLLRTMIKIAIEQSEKTNTIDIDELHN